MVAESVRLIKGVAETAATPILFRSIARKPSQTYYDSMLKAVVTGGAGFIGSHLADALLAKDYAVTVIDDLKTGSRANITHLEGKIDFVEGSILDDTALAKAFDSATFVFHQAAIPSVPKSVKDPLASHEANATGTLKVLLMAREKKVKRVIYAASSSVYGDTPILPKHEGMPPNPLSPYGVQKYVGEAYMQQFYRLFGLETVALRYFNIYGPRQNPDSEYAAVIPRFIRLMKRGEQPHVNGDGTATRGFTYIQDAVSANLCAAEALNAAGEVFNIAGRGQTSINELVSKINAELGTSITPEYGPERSGDIKHSYADISKAEKILGYAPETSLEEGLHKTAGSL